MLSTRREFLRHTIIGAATAASVPGFISNTFAAEGDAIRDKATQANTGKDGEILVIVQLGGGNDGLNTVIPHNNDEYYKNRPTLARKGAGLNKITEDLSLNSNLKFVSSLYDEGQLGIVQGVGYPNPNRSHFRSTEIWETATDSNGVSDTGWIGRYFDAACAGEDPTVGIALRKNQPQSFGAKKLPGVSLDAPELYRWLHGGGEQAEAERLFAEINSPETPMSGASITEVDGGMVGGRAGESNLEFLERVALDARVSSKEILRVASKYKSSVPYEGFPLARSLSLVSSMIAGGMPTRIYYVSHGGFDTHNNQAPSHDRLMTQLDSALKSFVTDLRKQGNDDRVTVMTFSEFGRRVKENQNKGTDHGAAAPLFVMGKPVTAGIYGEHPSLTDLYRGDLKFTTDFRSVYATVLEDFLKSPSKPVLGRDFDKLKLFGV